MPGVTVAYRLRRLLLWSWALPVVLDRAGRAFPAIRSGGIRRGSSERSQSPQPEAVHEPILAHQYWSNLTGRDSLLR